VFGINKSKIVRVERPIISIAGISFLVECTVFLYINKNVFKWCNDVEHLLKNCLTILIPDSANPFEAGWKGAPVKCLMPSVLQYDWNSTLLKHFELSVVIVLGIPKRATN